MGEEQFSSMEGSESKRKEHDNAVRLQSSTGALNNRRLKALSIYHKQLKLSYFNKQKHKHINTWKIWRLQHIIAFQDLNTFLVIGKVQKTIKEPRLYIWYVSRHTFRNINTRGEVWWVGYFHIYKYLTRSHMTRTKPTIPITANSMHMHEQPPLVRLFKIAKFFCTLCYHKRNRKG